MPEAEIAEALRLNDDDEDDDNDAFELWPVNARAVEVFLVVCRLWRVGPMGGVLGLDRPSVESELRMRKIEVDVALLDDLAVMEGAAAAALNAK